MSTRRDFLKTATLFGAGATVPAFLARTALAAPTSDKPGAKDTILVVVQLTGGNDGLNTVIPYKDAEYAKLRPTLKIPADQVKKINDSIGLHPSMGDLAGLLDDKALCVVQGVGYPNPSQSHFRSMDIWQGGSLDETITEGWLGKALKTVAAPAFHINGDNESSPLALAGAPARVPSIKSLEDFQLRLSDKLGQKPVIEATSHGTGGTEEGKDILAFVQRTAMSTYATSNKLQMAGKTYEPKSTYPVTPLANRLKLCAQLIDASLGARIFYVSIDGFDTHASQGGAVGNQANLLGTVSAAIAAFYKDLAARGHKDRLLVMTFSEFGRRARENGSKGTDHGSASSMFLVGGKVKAGAVGTYPSLTKLEDGNLVHNMDFRQVYSAILGQWLGVDAKAVLGKAFTPSAIFA